MRSPLRLLGNKMALQIGSTVKWKLISGKNSGKRSADYEGALTRKIQKQCFI